MLRLLSQYSGYPAPSEATSASINFRDVPVAPGLIVAAMDDVWGGAELIYARANGTIPQFGLCVLTPSWDSTNKVYRWDATAAPNTINLGRTLAVAQANGALVAGQYAWFMISGITPINGTASVAADTTFGITAAGQIGANTAGKQVLGGRVIQAATATVAKAGSTGLSGDTTINVPDTNGLFVGGYLSGAGVGASAVITFIDPLGKFIIASVANSAAINGTVTQTANNAAVFYNVAHINRPIAQGAIT